MTGSGAILTVAAVALSSVAIAQDVARTAATAVPDATSAPVRMDLSDMPARPVVPPLRFDDVTADYKTRVAKYRRNVTWVTATALAALGGAATGLAVATKLNLLHGASDRPLASKQYLISQGQAEQLSAEILFGGALIALGVGFAF